MTDHMRNFRKISQWQIPRDVKEYDEGLLKVATAQLEQLPVFFLAMAILFSRINNNDDDIWERFENKGIRFWPIDQ